MIKSIAGVAAVASFVLVGCGSKNLDHPVQNFGQSNPMTEITAGPKAKTNEQSAIFSFLADREPVEFECRFDGEEPFVCHSPFTQEGLSEGAHYFEVRAVTHDGLKETIPAHWAWEIDLTPPNTVLYTQAEELTHHVDAEFEMSSQEEEVVFECSLNDQGWVSCTSPTTVQGHEGENDFMVRAIDQVGNADDSPTHFLWTLDTHPPLSSWLSLPADYSNETTVVLMVATDEPVLNYECELDDIQVDCQTQTTLQGLVHGTHVFNLWAIDMAENTEASALQAHWTTDLLAATAELVAQPAEVTSETSALFTYIFDEEVTLFCRLDQASFTQCESPVSINGLQEGVHIFEYYTKDRAGNISETQNRTWTIDTQPPATHFTLTPAPRNNDTTAQLVFEADETPVIFFCALNNAAPIQCTSPYDVVGLQNGTQNFSVYAVDPADNSELQPQSISWVVDTEPPFLSWQGPQTLTSETEAYFTGNHNDIIEYECFLDEMPLAGCAQDFQIQDLSEGQHEMKGRGRDDVGNWSSFFAYTWTVDTTPPQINLGEEPLLFSAVDESVISFSSEEEVVFYCLWNTSDFETCDSPVTLSNLDEGPQAFFLYGEDQAGNRSETKTTNWIVDTIPPSLEYTQTPSLFSVAMESVFEVSVVDATEVNLECQINSEPWEDCAPPVILTNLPEATHRYRVRGKDAAGNLSEVIEYVWEQNHRPETSIDWGPAGTIGTSEIEFEFSSNESPVSFKCQKDTGAEFECSTPFIWSGLSNGEHTLKVHSIDEHGSEDLSSAQRMFHVALCGNNHLDPGELCDNNVACAEIYPTLYESGEMSCTNNCLSYDESSCVFHPFSLGNEYVTFTSSLGIVDDMKVVQLVPDGKEEIVLGYRNDARARYLDVTVQGAPVLHTLFDYSGVMVHMWLGDILPNGNIDLVYSEVHNSNGGTYQFQWTSHILNGPSPQSFGDVVTGHQQGVLGQYISGGRQEFIFLSDKKVIAFRETESLLIRHEEGMTAVAVADIIMPGDSASEIIIFSSENSEFYFYQYSFDLSTLVHVESLAPGITIKEMLPVDVDQNGFMDLLVATEETGVLVLYNAEGNGFVVDQVSDVNGARHFFAFDADLDGDMDFGYWSPAAETAYWSETLQQGSWATHAIHQFANMSDIVFTDVDGDGDKDLLSAHRTGTIFWVENKANLNE